MYITAQDSHAHIVLTLSHREVLKIYNGLFFVPYQCFEVKYINRGNMEPLSLFL